MISAMHEKFDLLLEQDPEHHCPGLGKDNICVRLAAMAELPTRFGEFHIIAFENNRDGKEHVAITKGDVIGASDVPVRLHSECLTGDAIGRRRQAIEALYQGDAAQLHCRQSTHGFP